MTSLQSDRLVLDPVHHGHLNDVHRLHCDPGVVETVFGGVVPTIETTSVTLEHYREGWRRDGFGFWMVYERQASGLHLAGRSGLRRMAGCDDVEFGHCYLSSASGRGLALEAARLVVRQAFGPLRLERLVAVVAPQNEKGLSVAGRIGFRFVDRRDHRGSPRCFFELTPARFADTVSRPPL